MSFCKKCGAEALGEDVFCPQCGANLKETGTDKKKAPDKKKPKEGKPSKAEPDTLHNFIEECRNRGFSNAEIREELLKAGWKGPPINKALKPAVPKPVEPAVLKPGKKAEPAVPSPKKKEHPVPKPKGKKVVPEVPKPKYWPVKGEKIEPAVPQPKKKFWRIVGKIIRWLAAFLFVVLALASFRYGPFPSLIFMFLGLILIPPIGNFIGKKLHITLPKWLKILLSIIILFILFSFFFFFFSTVGPIYVA